jgi:hypothetical protein
MVPLPASTSEWTVSESIAEDPVIRKATNFAVAIPTSARMAVNTALRLPFMAGLDALIRRGLGVLGLDDFGLAGTNG